MLDWIKKKRKDSKFKGDGHKLTEERRIPTPTSQGPSKRLQPTIEAAVAGQAALARLEGKHAMEAKRQDQRKAHRIEMETQRLRLERSRDAQEEPSIFRGPVRESAASSTPNIPVSGIQLICPITDVSLPETEIEEHMEAALLSQLSGFGEESLKAAAHMIYTLNKNKDSVKNCVDVISRYIGNVIERPSEPKFQKIRMKNRAFQERVEPIKGAIEFLSQVGFKREILKGEGSEEQEEEYLVLSGEELDIESLVKGKELLLEIKPLQPKLDRCLRIFNLNAPKQSANRFTLPPDFFAVSSGEIKAEQRRRAENIEQARMLKTKAMREQEASATMRKYRFCLIRVRFPDGMLLQGTFRPRESVDDVRRFAFDAMNEMVQMVPFGLMDPGGRRIKDESVSLAGADLVPSALVSVSFDAELARDLQPPFCRFDLLDKLETLD
eukprot:m.310479 g.310479  ORF g.310479 m.310479 type:complete len:439 (+) comp51896_c0_seq1:51-1367(+)